MNGDGTVIDMVDLQVHVVDLREMFPVEGFEHFGGHDGHGRFLLLWTRAR